MMAPHVAIAGGGPAGFLCALLLADCGIPFTLFEQSAVADPWSTKSFSISLNGRGMAALNTAGVLEEAKLAGTARNQVIMEMPNGLQKLLPKDPPNYAVTRPALVECLEQCLKAKVLEHGSDSMKIQRGVSVTDIDMTSDDSLLTLTLDNGSTFDCTHVVAADGKWSAVRNAVPDWTDQFQIQSEPAFGVIITPKISTPKRWATDATTLFLSKNPMYYCLAAPLPNGQYSVSAIFVDEIKEQHPWLVPEEDREITVDWEAEHGIGSSTEAEASVQEKFAKMIQEDLPSFYKDLNEGDGSTDNRDAVASTVVRINRRTSWLKPLTDTPNYSDATGRVVLVGDSAHAMTPSQGEGCNCALESAASLLESLLKKEDITVDDLTQSFLNYGTKRPSQVVPMQIKSAVANRYKERPQPPPPKK
jgi:2-polyprenyl-6-methoxyphenol hydroxylase-like FAD-dependent oxidoreductase